MEPLTLTRIAQLFPKCPRLDNELYAGDCAIRSILAGSKPDIQGDWTIEAGIGVLSFIGGVLHFEPAIKTEWPVMARPLKKLATPSDSGLGDVVARVIGPFGGDAFKKWYKVVFGKDCKCEVRQASLNLKFPL